MASTARTRPQLLNEQLAAVGGSATHNALDDANGNAEAMLTVFRELNVQVAKAQRAEMFGE